MANTVDENIYYCVGCGKIHPKGNFYVSYNSFHANGRLYLCKDFIKQEVYVHDGSVNIDRFKNILRQLDVPFLNDTYDVAVESGNDVVGSYFRMFNSLPQNKGLTWADSSSIVELTDEEMEEEDNAQQIKTMNKFRITDSMKLFWGNGFDKEEYLFLENKFIEYINTYECDTPVMEELLQQAAFESLEIRRKRQQKNDVSKNLKNIQDLLGSANIKPNQETGANANEQVTFGTLIKKWENEMPIPDPLPEWKEKDVIQYVKVWFLGHLSKMVGLNNPYAADYEKEIDTYKVDTPFEDNEEGGV